MAGNGGRERRELHDGKYGWPTTHIFLLLCSGFVRRGRSSVQLLSSVLGLLGSSELVPDMGKGHRVRVTVRGVSGFW